VLDPGKIRDPLSDTDSDAPPPKPVYKAAVQQPAPQYPDLDISKTAVVPRAAPPQSERNEGSTSKASAKWEWPAWSLQKKPPVIEVYVTDEETGLGRWVRADPESRVVDKVGNDAYLCAEYDWDGEFYVQDFSPKHVRRAGQKLTVFDMISAGEGKSRDQGAGINSFLDNSS